MKPKRNSKKRIRIKTRKTTQTIHLALRMNLIPKPMVTTRVKGMEIPKSKTMMLVMVKHLWKIMSRQSNLKGMKKVLRAVTVNLMESPKPMNRLTLTRMMLTELLPKSTVPMEILPMGKVTFLLSSGVSLPNCWMIFLTAMRKVKIFMRLLQMKSP